MTHPHKLPKPQNYEPYPNYPADEMWDNTLGDSSCVYPDKENNSIRSSIRVEALREASEINSILREARERNPEEVASIVEALVRDGADYETDINKMSAAREAILQLASTGKQTAFVPGDFTASAEDGTVSTEDGASSTEDGAASTDAVEEERKPENNPN